MGFFIQHVYNCLYMGIQMIFIVKSQVRAFANFTCQTQIASHTWLPHVTAARMPLYHPANMAKEVQTWMDGPGQRGMNQ